MYSIQGQGTSGQFRPYKSQIGYIFDQRVEDTGASGQLGVEIEGATGFHVGVDLKYTNIKNHTDIWHTVAKSKFENAQNNDINYEETYFKSTGDLSVDDDSYLFNNPNADDHLGGENPIFLSIVPEDRGYGKEAINVFKEKKSGIVDESTNDFQYNEIKINNVLKRKNREKRNQAILKVNKTEAEADPFVLANDKLKAHHTNGIKITNPNGTT